jgi:phosphate:Na+ symporter
MYFPLTLIDLAGAVALLLWGTHMVQTGIQKAFGPRLRSMLGHALRNRWKAFAAGLGVTTALQSSTATGLMTTGFVTGGLVGLVPGLAVMLGANVGTTLIVQALSFDIASVAPVLILVGMLMFRRGSNAWAHDLGRMFIGLGLMLLALHQLLELMAQYGDGPSLRTLLGVVSTSPLLDVFLAAGLTWAAHSSVVIVLLVMSLASQNIVPPEAALALVLGANLGTALNPLLEGTTSDDPGTRRLPLGNLIMRLVGVAIALVALPYITRAFTSIQPDPARMVADFHLLFNIAVALIFFPFLHPYARLLTTLWPDRIDMNDPSRPVYLDPVAKETPVVAIAGAAREAMRLADVLEEMLKGGREAIAKGDRKLIAQIQRRDDVLDHLNTAIKAYLTSMDHAELTQADRERLNEVLTFAMNIEQAGDVLDRNLLPHVRKRLERGLAFSKAGEIELIAMMDRLAINLRMAASLFMTQEPRIARLLGDEKVAFREAEAKAMASHFERLRDGHIDTAQTSALHLDLLRDMKLINSHIVAAAAYPVLLRSGELLPSRMTSRVAAPTDAPVDSRL